MKIENLPDIFFHGTINLHTYSIIEEINIEYGRTHTDFWKGFYLTSKPEQAFEWARDKAMQHNLELRTKKGIKRKKEKGIDKFAVPAVLAFYLNKEQLKKETGKIFSSSDTDWAGFIYNNRSAKRSSTHQTSTGFITCNDHNMDMNYKFVYGKIADRVLTDMLYKLETKKILFDTFLSQVRILDSDQLSFHDNVEARKALEFLEEVKNIDEAKRVIRRHSNQ